MSKRDTMIRALCKSLGVDYRVTTIDLERVIYRDFGNGFNVEISGMHTSSMKKKATIYLWYGDTMTEFPLTKLNKEGTLLNASHSYYTEEYAQRMCSLYLTDELSRDETGKIKRTYRLHASSDHTEEMAFAYEIHCPKCGNHLKQIGRQLTLNTLGLYKCPVCDRN